MKIIIQMGDSFPDESPCAKRMRVFQDVMEADGNKVIILAPKADASAKEYHHTIYCPTVKLKKKTAFYRFLNSFIFAVSSFLKAIKINNVDIVITTAPPPFINWFGWAIAKMKKAKLVYDVRDIWPDVALEMGSFTKDSLYFRIFTWIRDFMLRHADLTITVSHGKVAKLRNYCVKANVVEITNGLDEEFLKNEVDISVVEKYHLNSGNVVSYIGNMGLAQGLGQLLHIAKKAQDERMDVRFLLFGSGAEEKILRQYIENNNLKNVECLGRIPNKTIYTVLSYSKINFVSLVNENLKDSVPTKMYEALGIGCPVLLAACGDAVNILEMSRLGIAVKPNDELQLWKAFKYMFFNVEVFLCNKSYAQTYIMKNYSRQNAAKMLETELEKLIS